jgi:CubicO group peptidase (beta-lactamase class C family)
MRLKSALLLVLLAFSLINLSFGQTDKSLEGIEKDFEKILKVTKAPGFAIAIVKGNKILYAKGFGYRDLENKVLMDENTLLAIGSSSKAFTSAVLGQLRDEGKLTFDDSPIKYVKELKFYNDELNNGINIRDLMSHQTGIPRHDYSWYLFPTYNKDSLIQRIQYQEPFTGLRQKWYYNNFMFLVQGVIAERITGKSWEENVRERFFKPLGMERSNLSIKELEESSNIAIGYELYKDSVVRKMDYYRIAGMAPAGSINSSVKEMSNWLKVWINNGKFNEEQIIPETYIKEAMSSQAVITSALPNKDNPDMFLANYGYGWKISSYKGHYRVEHGGNIDGFSASVAFYPSDSIGIVVLANQNGSSVPSLVRNTVSDRLLNEKRIDWANYYLEQKKKQKEASEGSEEESASQQAKNTTPSHTLASYNGEYFHPGYGRFTISLKGDSLFANLKRTKFYLKHVHYDIFEPFEVTEYGIGTTATGSLKLNFSTNNAGEIASVRMKIEPALDQPIEFKREPETLRLELSELKVFEGEYEISGMVIKVYTKDDNGLYMFVPGQPEYQLLALGKNLFIVKDLEGYQ